MHKMHTTATAARIIASAGPIESVVFMIAFYAVALTATLFLLGSGLNKR